MHYIKYNTMYPMV